MGAIFWTVISRPVFARVAGRLSQLMKKDPPSKSGTTRLAGGGGYLVEHSRQQRWIVGKTRADPAMLQGLQSVADGPPAGEAARQEIGAGKGQARFRRRA
jgi:hypothetical protein